MVTKKQAKQILRSSGVSKKRLAKTTGTTRAEVTALFNRTARNLATGTVSAADTKAVMRALRGGKATGVPRQPKVAQKAVRTVRRNVRRANAGSATSRKKG